MTWLIELVPVIAAALCFVIAFLPEPGQHISHPVKVRGTVVSKSVQRIWHHHSETEAAAPVVRFETERGEQTATYRHFVPDWQYHYHSGDTVTICYNRQQPDQFRICGSRSGWRRYSLVAAGIAILFAYGVLWLQYHD